MWCDMRNFEFSPKISLFKLFFTFHPDHMNADIRRESIHCNMCIPVHWYCHKYTRVEGALHTTD